MHFFRASFRISHDEEQYGEGQQAMKTGLAEFVDEGDEDLSLHRVPHPALNELPVYVVFDNLQRVVPLSYVDLFSIRIIASVSLSIINIET